MDIRKSNGLSCHILKKKFMVPGIPVLCSNGQHVAYQSYPTYNKIKKINREGGGVTGYLYLKFNETEYAKSDQGFADCPVPQHAIDRNKNLLPQNPGWSLYKTYG